VDSAEQFLDFIKLSASKRVFSNNGVNERSSRSHHVFQIRIHGQDLRKGNFESLLNIIDLAGSERRASMQSAVPSKSSAAPSKHVTTSKTISKKPQQQQTTKRDLNSSFDQQQQLEQESISINKSLTTLGRIFMMLADRKTANQQKPPYRESKLTRILQDSLSYENKTLMIVNVCSGSDNF
jgi:kinesin family protein C1